ncbi:MAG: DUF3891 family protein [Thermoleophilaceae bacterium]|nr:DUF3891 family protein [Thermoleophilaceae bacterium]
MLVREDGDGVLVIGQASHAWLSGQLARAWSPRPSEEVCLAAEQHDVGMAEWDLRPRLHPSGRPVSFTEMELDEHLRLWSPAPDRLLSQSAYAALLVSMHGCALYEGRASQPAVAAYLEREHARQERLISMLGADREEVARDQRLVAAWDAMSLALCLGWDDYDAGGVTLSGGTASPWPFAVERLTVRCEGRRLTERFETEEALHAALDAAPRERLEFALARPGSP